VFEPECVPRETRPSQTDHKRLHNLQRDQNTTTHKETRKNGYCPSSLPYPLPPNHPCSFLRLRVGPRRQELLHNRRIPVERSQMQRPGSILRREGSAQTGTLFLPKVRALPPAPANLLTTPLEGAYRAQQTYTEKTNLPAQMSRLAELRFWLKRSWPCSNRSASLVRRGLHTQITHDLISCC